MTGKIGVLTGGGDCPGLNAAIRAVVRSGIASGLKVIGIRNGWQGLITNDTVPLSDHAISGIISWGGTILGSSRTDPLKNSDDIKSLKRTISTQGIDALVVIGGDGTLRAAHEVSSRGVPLVGIPKTIDNDIFGTDVTIGFDTAVSTVTEAIDRLHTTAESHHRIMVLEVMGRRSAGSRLRPAWPEVQIRFSCRKCAYPWRRSASPSMHGIVQGKNSRLLSWPRGRATRILPAQQYRNATGMNAATKNLSVSEIFWEKNWNGGWGSKRG